MEEEIVKCSACTFTGGRSNVNNHIENMKAAIEKGATEGFVGSHSGAYIVLPYGQAGPVSPTESEANPSTPINPTDTDSYDDGYDPEGGNPADDANSDFRDAAGHTGSNPSTPINPTDTDSYDDGYDPEGGNSTDDGGDGGGGGTPQEPAGDGGDGGGGGTPQEPAGDGGNGGGGGTPQAGPTPAQIAAHKEAQEAAFYDSLEKAKKAAAAGDSQKLKDFDKYFGFSRPAEEYTQEFYHGSSVDGRISAVNARNDISQDVKNKIILEIQSGNQDTVGNLATWFKGNNPPSRPAQDLGSSKEGRIELAKAIDAPQETKNKIILEVQSGNGDSIANLSRWFGAGKSASPGAQRLGSTEEGRINLTEALNIPKSDKQKIIQEIKSGNKDSVSNLVKWFAGGNPQSESALALSSNPVPEAAITEPATASAQAERGEQSGSQTQNESADAGNDGSAGTASVNQDGANTASAEVSANLAEQYGFPEHWGPPPAQQTRDMKPLPGGYGSGSGTLASWVQDKIDEDAAAVITNPEPGGEVAGATARPDNNDGGASTEGTSASNDEKPADEVAGGNATTQVDQPQRVTDPQAIAARKSAIESRLQNIASQRKAWAENNGAASVVKDNGNMVPPPIAGGSASQNGLPTQR